MATTAKNKTVNKGATTRNKTVKPEAAPKKETKVLPAIVKLCLRQMNGKGDTNSTVRFKAETTDSKTDIKAVVNFLGDRLFQTFELQQKIANKGGKSRLFKMTKGGKWYVDIDVTTETETTTLVAGLEFSFADLGTDAPKEVLQDVFEAWVLMNTAGTL